MLPLLSYHPLASSHVSLILRSLVQVILLFYKFPFFSLYYDFLGLKITFFAESDFSHVPFF